ncbi:MAG: DsrE/DsrF/DrsH-like family protein [Candidatus Nanopelagicales bacterium]
MTVIPNFDSDDSDRKFVIICSKGNLDMAYPALVLANAALGEGIETHLFFTFWGFDMILDSRMDTLQFSPAGNTAMHFPVKGKEFRIPQAVMPLPGMTGMATKMLKDQLEEMDIPPVRDFLDQIVGAGGHLWGCRMSADMNKVDMDDLYEGVEDIINATDFIEMTDGAQLLFI